MWAWTPSVSADYLYHHGIKGMHWGIRRFQNPDGTLTEDGYVLHFSKDHVGPEKWDALRGKPNIVMTQHSVGNRKMKGFDETDARFSIQSF